MAWPEHAQQRGAESATENRSQDQQQQRGARISNSGCCFRLLNISRQSTHAWPVVSTHTWCFHTCMHGAHVHTCTHPPSAWPCPAHTLTAHAGSRNAWRPAMCTNKGGLGVKAGLVRSWRFTMHGGGKLGVIPAGVHHHMHAVRSGPLDSAPLHTTSVRVTSWALGPPPLGWGANSGLVTHLEHSASSRDEDGSVSKLRHQLPHRGVG